MERVWSLSPAQQHWWGRSSFFGAAAPHHPPLMPILLSMAAKLHPQHNPKESEHRSTLQPTELMGPGFQEGQGILPTPS